MNSKYKKFFSMESIKNIIITHAVLLVLFAGVAVAFAQEPGNTQASAFPPATDQSGSATTPEEKQTQNQEGTLIAPEASATNQVGQEKRQQAIEAVREQVQERSATFEQNIAERRAALQIRAQERVINLAANMSNRIDMAIIRFEDIIARTETRIVKLQELGVDTAAAEAHLTTAAEAIATAKETIGTIDEQVAIAVSSEDARTAWQSARTTYATVTALLRDAHTSLREAIKSLKDGVATYRDVEQANTTTTSE